MPELESKTKTGRDWRADAEPALGPRVHKKKGGVVGWPARIASRPAHLLWQQGGSRSVACKFFRCRRQANRQQARGCRRRGSGHNAPPPPAAGQDFGGKLRGPRGCVEKRTAGRGAGEPGAPPVDEGKHGGLADVPFAGV